MCNSKYVSLTSLKLCVMDEFVLEHFYNTSVPNFKQSAGNKVRQEKLKEKMQFGISCGIFLQLHSWNSRAAVCGCGNAGLRMKREGEKVAKFSSHCHCCSSGGMHIGERFTLCKICAQVVPEQISFQILRISQSKSI